ncbi:MAG: dTDP-4-dehydrorhamnose 3,5-epimerase [Muribaculaceae bacterium]|nr:dTDP-4-dehydrorhamnose 3,5-epimerase [Muribaculaceae bacterium]
MIIKELQIKGLYEITPHRFGDNRGYFCETYNAAAFAAATGITPDWVQDNESFSSYGVVRGLHFQKGRFSQAKLVRAAQGEVLDVVVDLRDGSPTLGQYASVKLSSRTGNMLYIPRGFAHGFAVLSDTALFQYKVDNIYAPAEECTLLFTDAELAIDWIIPDADRIISPKDSQGLPFKEIIANYTYREE